MFYKFDQVTKSCIPLNLLKDFSYVLTLLTILFHHCILWTILRLGCLTGHARVIVWTMNAMVPSVFGNFALKGLDHFDRQISKASSRYL